MIFLLQIYYKLLESLEKEEDFWGVICTFKWAQACTLAYFVVVFRNKSSCNQRKLALFWSHFRSTLNIRVTEIKSWTSQRPLLQHDHVLLLVLAKWHKVNLLKKILPRKLFKCWKRIRTLLQWYSLLQFSRGSSQNPTKKSHGIHNIILIETW